MENDINKKLEKYLKITEKAIKKVKISKSQKINDNAAKEILEMAKRYYEDALYFKEKGDLINALAAVSYAHGWLDTAAYIGLFDVKDSKLFTVD